MKVTHTHSKTPTKLPASPAALQMLEERAQRLMAGWRTEEACQLALTLLKHDPQRVQACLILGQAASLKGEPHEALRWLLQAYALGHREPAMMLKAAEIALTVRDAPRAQQLLQELQLRAYALDPSSQRLLQQLLGGLAQLGQPSFNAAFGHRW